MLLLFLFPLVLYYCPWNEGHHAVFVFGFTTTTITPTTTTKLSTRTTTGRFRPLLLLHDKSPSSVSTTSATNNEFAQVIPGDASTTLTTAASTSNNETFAPAGVVAGADADAEYYSRPSDEDDVAAAITTFYPRAEEASSTASAVVAVMGSAMSSSVSKYPTEYVDILSLWKRRLITQEDPFRLHKISSITYTISAMIILGTGLLQYVQSPETWSTIPTSLTIPTYVFTISNIIMCAISVRMAFVHRKYDLTARNGFLGVASSSMFSGFYFLWTNTLGPDIFNSQIVTKLCFAIFVLLDVYFVLDTLQRIPEVVESRRDKKATDYNERFVIDTFGYVLPVIWVLPFILPTAYVDAILYNRSWFFEQCNYIDETRGFPGMLPCICYLQVALSLAASYGALFVTLRDKKLITKNQELVGITAFSLPALLWTIYCTFTFFQYLEW